MSSLIDDAMGFFSKVGSQDTKMKVAIDGYPTKAKKVSNTGSGNGAGKKQNKQRAKDKASLNNMSTAQLEALRASIKANKQ